MRVCVCVSKQRIILFFWLQNAAEWKNCGGVCLTESNIDSELVSMEYMYIVKFMCYCDSNEAKDFWRLLVLAAFTTTVASAVEKVATNESGATTSRILGQV
jgi:hypothetical protein